MACSRIRGGSVLAVAFLSIMSLLVRAAIAVEYTVGGDHGWVLPPPTPFNVQEWASSIPFHVGDVLYFGLPPKPPKPLPAIPAVVQVSPEAYEHCDSSQGTVLVVNTNFSITFQLDATGKFAFIAQNETACVNFSMKFTVTVLFPGTPSGPASPAPRRENVALIAGLAVGAAVLFVLMVIIFAVVVTRRRYWYKLRKSSGPREVDLSDVSDLNSKYHSNTNSSLTSVCHSLSGSTQTRNSSQTPTSSVDIEWPWGPQRFTYKELKGATKNFNSSLVVGEGGFGTVYKGFLRDSPELPVAVKRLSQYARQGAREFMAEVNIISQLRHRNLVQLIGWCDENEELILVYEFMPNGDLDDLIFGGYHGEESPGWKPLHWKHRYSSFCGVATALVYLHEEWEQRVVHRDVKTSNVMLDSHFNARLGDFGLARLSAHSQAPRTTLVAGTIGYLAPEFSLTGRATDKTDVYAFGVVVLEVSCARRPLTSNCILLDWVWDLHKEGKLLEAIDPKLAVKSVAEEEEMKKALQLGLLCCHPDAATRPTMRQVLNILTGEAPLPKIPRSKPVAFFADDDDDP